MNLSDAIRYADCPENGLYNCAVLAQWFWSRAEEIGGRFDRRSDYPNYLKKLNIARKPHY